MANTIALKGDYIRKEGEANSAITPGELIEFTSGKLQRHATIGGAARRAFALENDFVGKGVDDAYASGDLVSYGVFVPGAEVYVKVTESVDPGDALESAGNGQLQKASTPIESSIVAWAMESRSGAGRVRAEVN